MIIDLRTYTYRPAKFQQALATYQGKGFELTTKHLGRTLGVFRPESGLQNRTFQFFMYKDSVHRDSCRSGMMADPEWSSFIVGAGETIDQQLSVLLLPTVFSPMQHPDDLDRFPCAEGRGRLFELRSWTCKPEAFDDALAMLEEGGAQTISRYTPDVFGWFTQGTGICHRIIQLCAFADAPDRDVSRAHSMADPEVRGCEREMRGFALEEEIQHILPIACSPLR